MTDDILIEVFQIDDCPTCLHRCYSCSHTFNNTTSLMTQDTWEQALRVMAIKGVSISVADSSMSDFDANLEIKWY